ncbi:MAG: response regulator [Thermodesulfobacteriota bacterium]
MVDDSQADRMIISSGLRKMGHSVVACDDSEGWERLFVKGERFDVIILDMVMPRSGMDFVREIIRQGFTCRVIGVSAGMEGRFDDLLDVEKRFASAVLTKPVDMDSLKEALDLMLAAKC